MSSTLGWIKWSGSANEWDEALLTFDDANIYQSESWGLHRSNFGWNVTQMAHISNGTVTALAQVLHRNFSALATLCWIPGGPVGDLNRCDASFISCARKLFTAPMLYIHMSSMTQYSDELATSLRISGWRKPQKMLNSDTTLIYEIDSDVTRRRNNLSKNWSRNLSRGEQRGLTASEWTNPNASEISSLTAEMSQYKNLRNNRHELARSTESLLKTFENDILMVRCTNSKGELLALRGAIKLGHKAFDMFSAASPAGRKEYASNLCFWKLIELCERDGISQFDLSGVDAERNKGVYDFKKGTGATDFVYLGEWSYSRPRFVGVIVSRMIARRMRPE